MERHEQRLGFPITNRVGGEMGGVYSEVVESYSCSDKHTCGSQLDSDKAMITMTNGFTRKIFHFYSTIIYSIIMWD